ncbi:40143_t:CDS:1, partial [Gigaspora margarita]
YYDFGETLSKQYDYYRNLSHGDLASQSLVADEVWEQFPKILHKYFKRELKELEKFDLFGSINKIK